MKSLPRTGMRTAGTAVATVAAMAALGSGGAAQAAPPAAAHRPAHAPVPRVLPEAARPRMLPGAASLRVVPGAAGLRVVHGAARLARPPLRIKVLGHLPGFGPRLARTLLPTGLSPQAIASVYSLSGLAPSSGAGAGQIIAVVDAYRDRHALADLNTFGAQYGYPKLATCVTLAQPGPCFLQTSPARRPAVNRGWALEQSLDIEWAHAEAPGAKIVLVEAANNSFKSLFGAVGYADALGATEVSMSWGGAEFPGERADDSVLAQPGTIYVAAAGDAGHGAQYPAASPDVVAVGGTTLSGCLGTSCAAFTGERAWTGSGGGASAVEPVPAFQSGYAGPVSGAATIAARAHGRRGIPDVAFDANPRTGISVYDSTRYQGQAGWFTLGGTSVGAPNWAGILAAGAAAGQTALQGWAAIYGGGYATNLRDITRGGNGRCGTACRSGTGYDLVTGLGSPVGYP